MSERLLLLLPVPERSPVTAIKKAHSPLPPQNLKKRGKNATTDTVIVNTSGRSSLLPNLLLVQWLAGDECRPCTRLCDKFKSSKFGGKGWSGSEDCLDKNPHRRTSNSDTEVNRLTF